MKQSIFFLLAIFFSLNACHIFKKIDDDSVDTVEHEIDDEKPVFKQTPTMALIDSLQTLRPMPEHINFHFKGNLKTPDSKLPVSGIAGIRKDSAIWISARPGLGIEIARIYFFTDSMFILNRVQSQYYAYAYEELSKKMKQKVSYNHFEALFSARILTVDEKNEPSAYQYKHDTTKTAFKIYRKLSHQATHTQLINKNGLMISNILTQNGGQDFFTGIYTYEKPDADFPESIKTDIFLPDKISFDLQVFKYSETAKKVPGLKIPAYYTRAYLKFD